MAVVIGGTKLLVLGVVTAVAGAPAIVGCSCCCCAGFIVCCVAAAIVDVIEVVAAGLPPMLPIVVMRPTLVAVTVELFTCTMVEARRKPQRKTMKRKSDRFIDTLKRMSGDVFRECD